MLDQISALLPGSARVLSGEAGVGYYLGEGQHGTVYLFAHPDGLDPLEGLAVKVWKDGFRSRSQEVHLQRLAHEAAASSGRYRVPAVRAEAVQAGAFAMELVRGSTLFSALVARKARLSQSMFDEYSFALGHLNAAGVVHGDPHLGNLMVARPRYERVGGRDVLVDGIPWIIDFSSARGGGESHDSDLLHEYLGNLVVEDPEMDD